MPAPRPAPPRKPIPVLVAMVVRAASAVPAKRARWPTIRPARHMVGVKAVKPISADDLVAHAAWMRRLAAALAGPAGDPDDLVQEAFVSALRSPPDAGRPARPWLAQVLRNAARMRRRGDGRRAAREAGMAAGERERAAPGADELLERAEAQRALAAHVVALDEPFRRTLLLRYFEDVPPARIAELEGVAVATVRWRLSEGIARLRAGMDREMGGERGRW